MRPSRLNKYACIKVAIVIVLILTIIFWFKNFTGYFTMTSPHLATNMDDTMSYVQNLKNLGTRQDFDNEDSTPPIVDWMENKYLKRDEINTDIEELNQNLNENDDAKVGVKNGTNIIPNNLGNELNSGSSLNMKEGGSGLLLTGQDKNTFNMKDHHHWTISKRGKYIGTLYTPPPNEMPKRRFPQAIIIGFAKCGTRALLDFLRIHPNIVTAGPEIHFFDRDENYNKGLDWYLARMPFSYSNQITMEKTPFYVRSRRAMEEIYKLNKDMKLIVLMKNPVDRIVSFLLQLDIDPTKINVHNIDNHLKDDHLGINVSTYAYYLRPWMQKYPKSQIHIVEGREFVQNPVKEVQNIEKFLGVPPLLTEYNYVFNKTKGFYCSRQFYDEEIHCYSDNKGNHHPTLDPEVEKKLYSHFHDINEDLFRLIGKRFLWEPKKE